MLNKRNISYMYIGFLAIFFGACNVQAQGIVDANINNNNLPINVTNSNSAVVLAENTNALLSPSKPNQVEKTENPSSTSANDDFELKMRELLASKQANNSVVKPQENPGQNTTTEAEGEELDIDSPINALGNNILSKMDDDLFKKMSEIEKATTLLNLELRRERLLNEVEAQKAIRQKNAEEVKRRESEAKLKEFEEKKKAEALLLAEKQKLVEKQQLYEVLKQRKQLNAYMNEMLIAKQKWLKEKEDLYRQLEESENEKKVLIDMFKERIDKILEISQNNIHAGEQAKSNFERVVKNLRSRNEQLRKRVEADAKIIKNAKSNLYLKSKSIDELKSRNAKILELENARLSAAKAIELPVVEEKIQEPVLIEKLSSKYAILGISGRAGIMNIDLIGLDGEPLSFKVGAMLPTGHTVSEIGPDYAKFTRDGLDDYLYVGKTIDGTTSLVNNASGVLSK